MKGLRCAGRRKANKARKTGAAGLGGSPGMSVRSRSQRWRGPGATILHQTGDLGQPPAPVSRGDAVPRGALRASCALRQSCRGVSWPVLLLSEGRGCGPKPVSSRATRRDRNPAVPRRNPPGKQTDTGVSDLGEKQGGEQRMACLSHTWRDGWWPCFWGAVPGGT